jgi:hypothetical protein
MDPVNRIRSIAVVIWVALLLDGCACSPEIVGSVPNTLYPQLVRPIAAGAPGVVGHVVIIKGYITVAGTNYVILDDPMPLCSGTERLITYEEYADPAGTATHWRTWFNI